MYSALIEDAAEDYLAPETDQEFADPVDLDLFGLGALACLLLTKNHLPTGAAR